MMGLVLVKNRVWEGIDYEPNPAQAEIHAASARHRVVAAGRRTGKSKAGGSELVPEAFKAHINRQALEDAGKRAEFWIVGPEYTDSEKEFRHFYNACKRLKMPFDKPGTYYDERGGDMQVSLWDGRFRVIAKSAKYPDSLVGEGLHGVIMAEAAKMKESIWTKFIRPMLADYGGWSLWNSTPEGKNWFYDKWQDGQNPRKSAWWSARYPSWVNSFVFPHGGSMEGVTELREFIASGGAVPEGKPLFGLDPEIIEMAMDMSDEKFNQEIAALFTEFVGRVFKEFDEEIHVRDIAYDPSRLTFAAVDFGWTNPFVWLLIQMDIWGNVYVVDELYQTQKDTTEVAEIIKARGLCPSGIKAVYVDPAEPDDARTLQNRLRVPVIGGGATGGPLKIRLELIRQYLKVVNKHLPEGHVDRQPRLIINRKCQELIREMNDYRYPDRKTEQRAAPEEPLDKDNHGPEALGRFFRGHFGAPADGDGRPRVRRARVGV